MITTLWLLLIQGVMGAFDTIYFHEWRGRLPASLPSSATELRLHGARDLIYAVIFASLPVVEWRGALAAALAILVVVEIGITLADFIVEDRTRAPLFPGERATHAIMGIIYGAALANLAPVVTSWGQHETGLVQTTLAIPPLLRIAMQLMAFGVACSGVRDLLAAAGVRGAAWPWKTGL